MGTFACDGVNLFPKNTEGTAIKKTDGHFTTNAVLNLEELELQVKGAFKCTDHYAATAKKAL